MENNNSTGQNSLDVLSKLACKNISESSHFNSDPVQDINDSEIDHEPPDQVYLTADDNSDKTSNEAIATEFFEEYVCDGNEETTETSQGNFLNMFV